MKWVHTFKKVTQKTLWGRILPKRKVHTQGLLKNNC